MTVGKNKGKKVYTLLMIPARLQDTVENKILARESDFSFHAAVSAKSYQKDKIERLCLVMNRHAPLF